MPRRLPLVLSGLFLISACEMPTLSRAESPRPSRPSAAPSAVPVAAQATAEPQAIAPTSTPTPQAPVVGVTGSVALDASYLVASGAGALGSRGFVVGAGDLIDLSGSGIIAAGGGNIISAGGGNLIGQAGGNYRVRATEGLVPVEGLVLTPISLITREVMGPSVRTDAQGAFTLSIPQTAWQSPFKRENFLLYAAVPAPSSDSPLLKDPRLQYRMLASSDQQAAALLDEDSVMITTILRLVALERISELFTAEGVALAEARCATPGATTEVFLDDRLDPITKLLLNDFSCKLIAAADEHQVPASRYPAVSAYLADTVLALLELDMKLREPVTYRGESYTHVVPALTAFFGDVREAAKDKVEILDAEFGAWDGDGDAAPDMRILRPADASEYMVRRYLARNDGAYLGLDPYLARLGFTSAEVQEAHALLDAAQWGIIMQIGVKFLALNNAQLMGDGQSPLERIMRELGEAR